MQIGREAKRRIREKAVTFEADLLKQVNGEGVASQRVLACSAAASYAAISQVSFRLCAANFKKSDVMLAEMLPSLQSSLLRTLGAMGVAGNPSDDEPRKTESLQDIIREHDERKAREAQQTTDGAHE
jgi:hypothetical protein